jgi:hypothetical protein
MDYVRNPAPKGVGFFYGPLVAVMIAGCLRHEVLLDITHRPSEERLY